MSCPHFVAPSLNPIIYNKSPTCAARYMLHNTSRESCIAITLPWLILSRQHIRMFAQEPRETSRDSHLVPIRALGVVKFFTRFGLASSPYSRDTQGRYLLKKISYNGKEIRYSLILEPVILLRKKFSPYKRILEF